MAESLRLTQFRPSGFKVKCIEFHPMQPWLAIADKGNHISVWDFESEQVPYPPPSYTSPSPRAAFSIFAPSSLRHIGLSPASK